MIWFFLALIVLAIMIIPLLNKQKTDAKVAKVKQDNVRMANHFNNQKIRDMMSQYDVAGILSAKQRAEHEAALSGGVFTLEPDVERSLQAKIEEEKKTARRDAQLADAICLAYEDGTTAEHTFSTEAPEAVASFQDVLRNTAETGFQNRGTLHLDTLKKLSKEAHQQIRFALRQEAQDRGSALPFGESLQAKIDLPLPAAYDDKELFDLMHFVGYQVEGYDLISPYGPGKLLVWRHRDLLDVYISLIQKECAADGIHVSYKAQLRDGFDGVPVAVDLPCRLTEKPRSHYWPGVALCVSREV